MPAEWRAAHPGVVAEHGDGHGDHVMRCHHFRGGRLRELAELIREVECRGGGTSAAASSSSALAAFEADGEGSHATRARMPRPAIRTGWSDIDQLGVLVRGVIHEWFALGPRDDDFTPPSMRERGNRTPVPFRRAASFAPPLIMLAHLAGAAMDQARDQAMDQARDDEACCGQHIAWLGRRCWPYPRLLIRSRDIDHDRSIDQRGGHDWSMLERSIFIDPPDDAGRLWSIDLALRSGALAAVVADGSKLDMAATRRLQLAAERGGTLALLVRPARELDQLSAASTRWVVRTAPSPGRGPRWSIELQRCKGSRSFSLPLQLPGVELTDATRLVAVSADVVDRSAASPAEPANAPGCDRSHAARRSA